MTLQPGFRPCAQPVQLLRPRVSRRRQVARLPRSRRRPHPYRQAPV